MINRRDLFKFAAGSAAGAMVTPLPWKLLDDSAIWTQTGPWAAKLPRGPLSVKLTHCTICDAGCSVKMRCVGGRPVNAVGVPGDPLSGGKLCTVGVVAHHLPYHPGRARDVLRDGKPARLADLVAAVRAASGPLAVLDGRPGRAVSELYRRFAASAPGALHLMPRRVRPCGSDLERTRLVLSFGVPVLEDWTAPGRVWAVRGGFRLIQVEPRLSATAMMADRWLPVAPGSEEILSLAVGAVMLREGWHDKAVERAADDFDVYRRRAGEALRAVDEVVARDVAKELAQTRPAIVLGGGAAGWALNVLSGNVGRSGGFLPRRTLWDEGAKPLAEVKDASLGILLVDSDTPYVEYAAKLAKGALVVELSPFPSAPGSWIVPPPVFTETLEDIPASSQAVRASLRLSPALVTPPKEAVAPEALVASLAVALGVANPGTVEDVLRRRVSTIHASRRGSVQVYGEGAAKPVREFRSPEKMWNALLAGASWADDEPKDGPVGPLHLLAEEPALPVKAQLVLVVSSPRSLHPVSPLLSKLYQESGLRPPANLVRVNPQTGASHSLADGCRAKIRTERGEILAVVRFDTGVRPDVLEAEARLASLAGPARIGRV